MIQRELRSYEGLNVDTAALLGPLSTIRNLVEANAVLFLWKVIMEADSLGGFVETLSQLLL